MEALCVGFCENWKHKEREQHRDRWRRLIGRHLQGRELMEEVIEWRDDMRLKYMYTARSSGRERSEHSSNMAKNIKQFDY